MRKTKIICTLGPASSTRETMRAMVEAGMNVARFNFSHGSHESHLATFLELNRVRNDLGVAVATILDTKGPEVRIGTFEEGRISLKEGDPFDLVTFQTQGNQQEVSISYPELPQELGNNRRILLDDGLIKLEVLVVLDDRIHNRVVIGGDLSNRKGINIPGVRFSMPYISESDRADILFGIRTGFDYVAASFVRGKEDVETIRRLLDENGGKHVRIIAKIENADGVAHIDEITAASDAVMIARGDMGVEIPFEEIPIIQKRIIKAASMAGRQVITATQMLDSMRQNPRPTRAEASDVANAIFDGTDAVMLSGETAVGRYPVEAVSMMRRIACSAEKELFQGRHLHTASGEETSLSFSDALSRAAARVAEELDTVAIAAFTQSGSTARLASKCRPRVPIIAATPLPRTARRCALYWGVQPVLIEPVDSTEAMVEGIERRAREMGLTRPGDVIVVTAGSPVGQQGTTNMMKLQVIR